MAAIKCSGPKVPVSRFALLAEADSDNEEEVAVGHACSCSGLACIHIMASPAAFAIARDMVRPRFWLWPLSVEQWDNPEVWPCSCTDPAHALDGENGKSVFSCSHGSWLMVYSADEAEPRDEDLLWGDIITIQDRLNFEALPADKRAAIEAHRAAESKAIAAAAAASAVDEEARKAREAAEFAKSVAQLQKDLQADEAARGHGRRHSGSTHGSGHAAAGGGAPAAASRVSGKRYDRKTNMPMPCRCHAHDGVPGQIAPASSGVNKKGEKFSYPAGCQQHDDFVAGRTKVDCPFFHIGDVEWRIIVAMHATAGGKWRV
jgi:hypothetical protein